MLRDENECESDKDGKYGRAEKKATELKLRNSEKLRQVKYNAERG